MKKLLNVLTILIFTVSTVSAETTVCLIKSKRACSYEECVNGKKKEYHPIEIDILNKEYRVGKETVWNIQNAYQSGLFYYILIGDRGEAIMKINTLTGDFLEITHQTTNAYLNWGKCKLSK